MYCKYCGNEFQDGSETCPNCQSQVQQQNVPPQYQQQATTANSNDKPNFGFALLGFFIPLIGLILYFVWRDEKPLTAKSCIKGFFGSLILWAILTILLVVLMVVLPLLLV